MVYTKPQLYNLALSALLLQRQISDPVTDKSNEAKVLNSVWDAAFYGALQDLDLERLSEDFTLELKENNPDDLWLFAYKYPSRCAHLRRIKSCVRTDNRYTHIAKRVGQYDGETVIFTNQEGAILNMIPRDVPLTALSRLS